MSDVTLESRIREALTGRPVREVRMFGGLSFLVDGNIVVAARAGGDLLVRIAPRRRDEFLGLPGVSAAVMGGGRPMGRQWITVDAASLTSDAELREWLDVALDDAGARRPGD